MLVEFSVANFRSFRERVTLSLEAEPRLSERDKTVDERNVAHTDQGDLLRVVGVYGANASGKSNLIRALRTLRSLVLDSARGQDGDFVPADPFRLDATSPIEPTEIEVVYTEAGRQVRYGAAFTRERITHEWLFVRASGADDEVRWFERRWALDAGTDRYETGGDWVRNEAFELATRKEALHLSVTSQFNHDQSRAVLSWFRALEIADALDDRGLHRRTLELLGEPKSGPAIRQLLRRLDLGLDDVKVLANEVEDAVGSSMFSGLLLALQERGVQPKVDRRRITTVRGGQSFELTDESAGTVRAIGLAGPIIEALARGQVLVVDEFDARLHTLLAKQLVELFQDPETNPHDAQLIFASHDTNLLTRTLLRRDQLYFVEKSHKTQASDLYSLAELRLEDGKRVRNDARYEEDYLQGRYGAIPFFGNLKAMLGEVLDRDVRD